MAATLDTFFANVKLPTISTVAQELIKSLNDEDAGIREVGAIIAKDPSLTAKLLRLANSAQFGLSRGVSSLDEAIQMVGMSRVRTLCLGACLCESFPSLPGLDANEFWRASMACAGYSQWLAGATRADAQQAWLAGMMLRLGELLIGQADASALAEIEKLPHLPGGRWEREVHQIGHNEGQVTGELARRWNFPGDIVAALRSSCDPTADKHFVKLAGIVHVAGMLADIEDPKPESIDLLPPDVLKALGLDPNWMKEKLPSSDSFVSVA